MPALSVNGADRSSVNGGADEILSSGAGLHNEKLPISLLDIKLGVLTVESIRSENLCS